MTSHGERPVLTGPRPDDLAAWIEHRLDQCITVGAGARLYGLEVIDPHGFAAPDNPAGRLTFVAEDRDATALVLAASCADAVRRFDAVALAVIRWEPALVPLPRPARDPSGHPVRRRARVVTVVGDAGTASARRFDHAPERVELRTGLAGAGIAGVQLAAMWSARGA